MKHGCIAWVVLGWAIAIALMGFGVVIVRLRHFQALLLPHPGIGWKLGLTFALVVLLTSALLCRPR